MNLKDEFLNKINIINATAEEYGLTNAKGWLNDAYSKGILSFDEKEELFRFVQMRNMISHGSSDRINVFQDDIEKLDYYIKKMRESLGIVAVTSFKEEKVKKEDKTIDNYVFNNNLKMSDGNKPSDKIRNLFIRKEGRIVIETINHKVYDVYLTDDGERFTTIALGKNFNGYTFGIFDMIVEFLKQEGGRAVKGSARGYNKLGDENCDKHTVVGYLGYNFYKKTDGESFFDPVFVLAAILDYAGICENTRGFLILK